MFMDQRCNIVKIAVLLKLIYVFSTILINIPASFFEEIDKLILKFIQKLKGPRSQNSLEKEDQSWRTHISQLQNLL